MEEKKCYLISKDKTRCTGCRACSNICPKEAISMVEDDEGFIYPYIDETKCIECHLCEKVCPFNKKEEKEIKPQAYVYVTNDEKKRLAASSGGAFGDIVEAFYDENNTIVFGCVFDDNNKAIHIGYESKEDIEKFKKSKYVQSNTLNTFKEVKDNLLKGKKVIYSGTPCQIAGLKSFLMRDYDNLLCVDIICHGVPSQKLLDLYINEEEKENNSKLIKLNFREKVKDVNGDYSSKNIRLFFQNHNIIKNVKESTYLTGFQSRLFYRPSCYVCNYCKVSRLSDITISDAWGLESNSKYNFHKGVSYLITNTPKGSELIKKIKGKLEEIPIDYVINENRCYTKPTEYNKNRNKFFKHLNSNNFNYLVKKYSKDSLFRKISKKLMNLILKLFKK